MMTAQAILAPHCPWVGHHVVRFLVNDERRAPVGEDRVFRVLLERNAVGHEGDVVRAVRHYLQVNGHVARVRSLGILGSMLFVVGIEMAARGLEIRPIAFRVLMDVERMLAFGKIHQVQLDLDPLPSGVSVAVPASWPWLVLKSTSRPLFLAAEAESASKAGSVIVPMHTLSNLVILFLALSSIPDLLSIVGSYRKPLNLQ